MESSISRTYSSDLYDTIMKMLVGDPENSSRVAELIISALKEGESLRDIMNMLSNVSTVPARYYVSGRGEAQFIIQKEKVIRLVILRMAQFILDKGESLLDLVENLRRIGFSVLRTEIVAMYLGYDLFAEYCTSDSRVYSVLTAAYKVSYDRLVRVIGFYLKYGYTCIDLLYRILPSYMYWHVIVPKGSDSAELLIANIIVTECGEPFENLIKEARDNDYKVLIHYLERYGSSGV